MKRLYLIAAVMAAAPASAQLPDPPRPGADTLAGASLLDQLGWRERLSGELTMTSESYAARGGRARRPGQAWNAVLAPQFALPFGITMSGEALLSSEGVETRQSINQLALNPTWKWASANLGDFSRGYSNYTVQGVRVRGLGLELAPGRLRVGLQGGRTQRAVSPTVAGATPVYERRMLAGHVGLGRREGAFVDLTVAKLKDDPRSVTELVIVDPIEDDPTRDPALDPFAPTLDDAARPQENLVVGLGGRVPLFGAKVTVGGEVAGAVITRDLESPRVGRGSVSGAGPLGRLMDLRLSSAGDLAYNGEIAFSHAGYQLRGAYEAVGAGYTSLGLGYLINDRRSYQLGGAAPLLGNRLSVTANLQRQEDNLLGQKIATTSRDALTGGVTARISSRISAGLTGMLNVVKNDAANDTLFQDNRAEMAQGNVSFTHALKGRTAAASLSYGVQRSADGNVVRGAPTVVIHNASAGYTLAVSKAVSVSPTLSAVVTKTDETPGPDGAVAKPATTARNAFAGFRGQGRFLDGKLRSSASATRTFTNGRQSFALRGQGSYELPWGSRLTLQARHDSYAAFRDRPAFTESWLTTSIARSF